MRAYLFALGLPALLSVSVPAVAQMRDPDVSMKRMQTVLSVLNQELTATYDQIKALQSALSANDRSSLHVQGRPPPLTNEEEVAAEKRKFAAREQEIQAQMDAAFKRIKEIEAQKQPILQRLQEYLDAERASAPPTAPVAVPASR